MKYCVFIIFIWIAIASTKSPPKALKQIPVVDALIRRLEAEKWTEDEACYRSTLQILYGVKNDTLWATWIWDSMQHPTGAFYGTGIHFGNYEQCLNVPRSYHEDLSTQYCLVDVKVQEPKETREFGAYDSADEYLNTLTSPGRTLNQFVFGACMPAVCSPSSISKFYKHVLQMSHLPDAELVTVDPTDCQTPVPESYPGKFYAYLSVFGALLAIATASTVYTHSKELKDNSTIDSIAKSFCLAHNWTDLFKVNRYEIRALHGMRVITAVLVIACHQALFSLFLPSYLINSVEVDKIIHFDNEFGQSLTHVDLIVDTFFAISGLLLIRGLLGGRRKNLFIVLIKRYFRLMGPYAATTLYIMCIGRYIGSGPIWSRIYSNEEGVCEKHWWKNIFMMVYDMRTMCYGVAWYVTCDYHLAVLTVFLFWIYRSHKQTGIVAFIAVSFGLTAQFAVNAYVKGLPLVPFDNVVELSDIRQHKMMNVMYIRWHDRTGSYLVGAAMGALMTMYKPTEHRNVISKTTSYILVIASLFVMMKLATINYWFPRGPISVAIATATNRSVWAMAICCLIAVCEYGRVGLLNDFLGSAAFVPISKLCYGTYLTHFFIIQRNLHVTRSAFTYDFFNMTICTLGTMGLSCVAALVLYLLVETPCMNLANVFLSESNEKTKINEGKPANGKYQNISNGVQEAGSNEIKKSKTS